VVAASGAGIAFAVDAASFATSALTLFGIRRSAAAPSPTIDTTRCGPEGREETRLQGLRDLLRSERVLWVILALSAAAHLGSEGMAEVALPALVRGPLRAGAVGYGAIVAAFGAGALVGTAVAAQLRSPGRLSSAAAPLSAPHSFSSVRPTASATSCS